MGGRGGTGGEGGGGGDGGRVRLGLVAGHFGIAFFVDNSSRHRLRG